VWAFTGLGGGYAEQALVPVGEILPLPADLAAAGAVTLGSSGAVAHFALAHARFAPGESVLVRGAAGSIGIITAQLAARAGAGAVADFGMQLFAAFQQSPSFATFSANTVPAPDLRAVRTGQFAAASRGELELVVHEVLPLEQAVLAHQKMDAGEVFGRIVLVPSSS
jgi:NADPH:quinone reductase-like Zn-dependent oxidoreductase